MSIHLNILLLSKAYKEFKMETILFIGAVVLAYNYFTQDDSSEANHNSSSSNIETKESHVTNNYYVQNTINIQVNHHSRSSEELKDHSENVWERLGYKVIDGEDYTYKMYGKEIYTPNQVEQIGSTGSLAVKYSEEGLVKKLLDNTGSKRMTKDILAEQYGYSPSEAKELIEYIGY